MRRSSAASWSALPAAPVTAASPVSLRRAAANEAPYLHQLITANVARWHLLPRGLEELRRRAGNFTVATIDGTIVGCAELVPLSRDIAEIRSLVVEESRRGGGTGTELVCDLLRRARADGFARVCAFTHNPRHFLQLGFSIVPHIWLPEKVATDCTTCPAFRTCGQYAVLLGIAQATRRVRSRNATGPAAQR